MPGRRIRIYDYTDYRKFLRDWIAHRKEGNPRYSYRVLCNRAGLKSTGSFTTMLHGRSDLSLESAGRIALALGLRVRETEYFTTMTLFNKCNDPQKKREYFRKMMTFRDSVVRKVDAAQFCYYDRWYHSVVRGILEYVPFDGDFSALARMLKPAITPSQARESVSLLTELGLIRADAEGRYRPVDAHLDSGSDAQSLALMNCAIQTIDLARRALIKEPRENRHIAGMTLAVSEQSYLSVVEELRELRRRIYRLIDGDKADRVYQLNLQFFPVSQDTHL